MNVSNVLDEKQPSSILLDVHPYVLDKKYNPIERTWAALENHWNGSILDEVETALNWFFRTYYAK